MFDHFYEVAGNSEGREGRVRMRRWPLQASRRPRVDAGVNHPNGFGHLIYAECLIEALD